MLSKEARKKLKERELSRKIDRIKKKMYCDSDRDLLIKILDQLQRVGYRINENGFLEEDPNKNYINYPRAIKLLEEIEREKKKLDNK